MSKAIASCTCATCGKTFEVTAYKHSSSEARSFERWAESSITECPACRDRRIEAKRAEENAQAAEAAVEMGWPDLTGSDKQVAWATTIRGNAMSRFLSEAAAKDSSMRIDPEVRRATRQAIEIMLAETRASWWIDNRDMLGYKFRRLCLDIQANPDKYALAPSEETELKDDAATIAEPEERTHDGVVEITAGEKRVSAAYRKDDDFRTLVKGLGYSWNSAAGAWSMAITVKTGTPRERAAELGNKLLAAGFSIRIQDADTLRDAIEGNYEPMTYRWISKLEEQFFITWPYEDSFYDRAKRLPGARYEKPGIKVPAREHEAVMDFARTYGFRLTPGAQELLDEQLAATVVVTPAAPKTPQYDEHPVAEILDSSREIIDDLKD